MAEYRLEELAQQANTTVRNIRAYRDRKLLPPPRRQGRVAIYNDAHLGRLRLIADLLARGYTLGNIAELIAAWERGKDVADILGLEAVLAQPWSQEQPEVVTHDELRELLGPNYSEDTIRELLYLGVIDALDEDGAASELPLEAQKRFRVASASELTAGNELVSAGVPVRQVLALGRQVHDKIDVVAKAFVELISTNLFDPLGDLPPAEDIARIAATVQNLRPLAQAVVDAELARAMERYTQHHLSERFDRFATQAGTESA